MRGGASIFDSITYDDLIRACFPCIYFETVQMMYYDLTHKNVKHLTMPERIDVAIDRIDKRTHFHILLYKLVHAAVTRCLRLVIENPAGPNGFITSGQNFIRPAFVDKDRTRRGDFFVKPTAYFFINCEPMRGYFTEQQDKRRKTIESAKSSSVAGLCSEERSMISPDYARNFICDFLLGKEQPDINPTLFNFEHSDLKDISINS